MKKILDAVSNYLALWVLLGALAAYFAPAWFEWTGWSLRYVLGGFLSDLSTSPTSNKYDLLGQPVFKWMFVLTMFAVGTVIDTGSFVSLARRPLAVFLGLLTQFSVMPLLAWLTTRLGGFDADVALGFIIVGCAPGAMTSNVLTYLARGDTAYSVTLTTFASIISVLLTPALVWLLAGEKLGMTEAKFWEQLWTIAWTVATPLLLGLLLRRLTSPLRRLYEAASPAVASLAIIVICCFVIKWTHTHLGATTPGIFAGVIILNALGFLIGGFLGSLYRLDRARRITLSIEIGMQNAGMGVILAASTFSGRPRVAIPAALFTIWCILTAAVLIAVLKGRSRDQREESPTSR